MMIPLSKAFASSEVKTDTALAGIATTTLPQRQIRVTEGAGDAAAARTTSYEMSVDDTFDGSLTAGDTDWIAVDLVAGETYIFSSWGRGGSDLGIYDTVLRVYNGNGVNVAENDDVATYNRFSLIEYTAPASGTYYVAVTGFNGESGLYTVQVADDVYSIDQVASYLTDFDWAETAPLHFDVSPGGQISVNLTGLTAVGRQLARWALETWETALGIEFVETISLDANIVFDDDEQGAFAGPVDYNPVTGILAQAEVNVGQQWLTEFGTTIDSYSFQTYLHEIGHALGLGHAGPYDVSAEYGVSNAYLNDSTLITIMSYFHAGPPRDPFDAYDNPNVRGDDLAPISPMIADLVAVHDLYGTPQTYLGNTTWGANSNVGGWLGLVMGELFDGVGTGIYDGAPIGLTIYDTGGIDTVDLSTVTVAQRINLTPESDSDIAGFNGNVVIARGTVLENVIGGSAADDITGNAANNRIEGGRGNDTVNGGAGTDTAVLEGTLAQATVTQNGGTIIIQSAAGSDTYTDVEFFEFSDGTYSAAEAVAGGPIDLGPDVPTNGDDSLVGTGGNDQIDGLNGNDTIRGGDGDDGLKGSGGNDSLEGGAGNDRLPGAAGDDTILGGDGNDRLGGGDGNDFMDGGNGNDRGGGGNDADTILGGDGNDVFSGGAGNDSVDVGAGNDRAAGSFGNDTVRGGGGDDTLGGGRGNDLIDAGSGHDVVGAGEFNDTVYGRGGNDFLGGGDGDDFIDGGTGNDTINSGFGTDTVVGGEGADVFVFNALSGGGYTIIEDFQDGLDRIQVTGLRNPADPVGRLDIGNIVYEGQQAVTMSYGDHTIVVLGAREADFSEADFIFG